MDSQDASRDIRMHGIVSTVPCMLNQRHDVCPTGEVLDTNHGEGRITCVQPNYHGYAANFFLAL